MISFKSSETLRIGLSFKGNLWRSSSLVVLTVACIVFQNLIVISHSLIENAYATKEIIEVAMPGVRPTQDDQYLFTSVNVESRGTQYIYNFEPNENAVDDRAHHMALHTCDDLFEGFTENGWWDEKQHRNPCQNMKVLFVWAKNGAEPIAIPKDVGFRIGAESKNLVLQVHYAHPLPEGTQDRSGFRVYVTPEEPRYLAGIMLLLRHDLEIPPKTDKIHADINCPLATSASIHIFAYSVHTHKLGVVVSGYKIDHITGFITEIGKGNPQLPQAFYPIKDNITIEPTDYLAARCTFSTTNYDKATRLGPTIGDEMCNMYLMFYTESKDLEENFLFCADETFPKISQYLPHDSDVPVPRNESLELYTLVHHTTGIAGMSPVHSDLESPESKPVVEGSLGVFVIILALSIFPLVLMVGTALLIKLRSAGNLQ